MHDYPNRYGVPTRTLHHLMLALMVFQFFKLFNYWNDKQNFISQNLPNWHATIGVVLGFLVIARVIWTLMQRSHRAHHGIIVKMGHFALYVLMFLAPISGVCLVLGKGYGLKVFGVQLIARGSDYAHLLPLGQLHSPLTIAFCVLVAGHAFMAFYHHFVKGDKLLKKMFG